MKLDIRGYFMHIGRERLLQICRDTLLKMHSHRSDEKGRTWGEKLDYGLILYLTEVIIMNNPLIDCHRRGAASDWDKFIKRLLGCNAYGQYVDDSYVVSNHKGTLRELVPYVEAFLKALWRLFIQSLTSMLAVMCA